MSSKLLPKSKKNKNKKTIDLALIFSLFGSVLILVAIAGLILPAFLNPFPGFQFLIPLIGAICGIVGSLMNMTALIIWGRVQIGVIAGTVPSIICGSMLIAWVRYVAYVGDKPISEYSPANIFSGIDQYPQKEFLAGDALVMALVFLGLLVSCVPFFRARDIPENIEKQKQEEAKKRQNRWATPNPTR